MVKKEAIGRDATLGSDPDHANERGIAIILAMVFVVIAAGMVTSGALLMKSSTDRMEVSFRRDGQAAQFARSGLTEALGWFRRQTTQPVTQFSPVKDTGANPPILDTDDPVIGLVREFEISGDIWGRYEVWREDESDPDPKRLAFRRLYQVEDQSRARGFAADGQVWLVRCWGYVYQKRSSGVAWNAAPNRVLAMSTMQCEIQRLSLQPPGQAAVCISRGDGCTVETNGRIRGGAIGAGVFYPSGTGDPIYATPTFIEGTPKTSTTNNYDASVKRVFGVARDELRSMADLVITDPDDFPDPIPPNSIVFVDVPSITFDNSRSLNGAAIVYIDGDVSIAPGNHSSFNGMLYAEGNVLMRQTSDIYGAVVVQGSLTVKGSAGDRANIRYDDDILNALRTEVGQYRWSGAYRAIINRE